MPELTGRQGRRRWEASPLAGWSPSMRGGRLVVTAGRLPLLRIAPTPSFVHYWKDDIN
jgi:hypothetical protein